MRVPFYSEPMTLMKKSIQPKFPVENYQNHILSAIKNFKILIIVGETGSGKTTIIPIILYKNKIFNKIIVSQTRRIAAINAAKYVSSSLNLQIGKEIGYAVRFDDKTHSNTEIKFVTDGILFREASQDPLFSRYGCLILDEFHERTIYTDLLLSLIKKALLKRDNLNLIIMSASGDCEKMAKYFNLKTGKMNIPGRLFRIKIYYTKIPQYNYIFTTSAIISKFHFKETIPGNFLVFLPGQEEIEKVSEQVQYIIAKRLSNYVLIKFHSNISYDNQLNIFKPLNSRIRKIILATNIAESSITIPGVSVVIDSGLSKHRISNWKNGIDLFRLYPISKSEAQQRAGRAGRESNGKCFRLFTFVDFSSFRTYPIPEIQRIDLTTIVLQLYTFKLKCFFDLDFVTMPPIWSLYRSIEKLYILGAIKDNLQITAFGKLFAVFPLDVNMSVTLVETLKKKNQKLLNWTLAAAAVLSTNIPVFFKKNIFNYSENFQKLEHLGDHFYLARLLYEYQINDKSKYIKNWYKKKNLNENCLKLALSIKAQIHNICFILAPFVNDENDSMFVSQQNNINDQFRLCFTAGYFPNSARLLSHCKKYQGINTGLISEIHPLSVFNLKKPKTIIFHEFIITNKPYIKGILPTRLIWLLFFGKKIFT
nr:ATP-dependent RNA helicase CDC28 [Cryptomonas sp.]